MSSDAVVKTEASEIIKYINTWMVSAAVCLLCVVGVKDTVNRAPVEPTGGNIPEAGVTVNSLLLPGSSAAVNGSGLLETTLQIQYLPVD